MTTLQIQVNGLTSDTQSHWLATRLQNLRGVTSASVDTRTGTISVNADGGARERVTLALTGAGYELASEPPRGWNRLRSRRAWSGQVERRPMSTWVEQHRVGILPW